MEDGQERARKLKELGYKLMKFSVMTKRPFPLDNFPEYPEYKKRLIDKLLG